MININPQIQDSQQISRQRNKQKTKLRHVVKLLCSEKPRKKREKILKAIKVK